MSKHDLGTFDKVYKPYKARADNSAPEILSAITLVLFVTAIAIAIIAMRH